MTKEQRRKLRERVRKDSYRVGLMEVRGLLRSSLELIRDQNFEDAIACSKQAVRMMRWTEHYKPVQE